MWDFSQIAKREMLIENYLFKLAVHYVHTIVKLLVEEKV